MSASKPGILILNDTSAYAGTDQYIAALASELRAVGENVSVACPMRSPLASRLQEGEQFVVPVCPAPFNFKALKTVTGLLKNGSIQILHANNGRTALFGAMALKLAGTGRLVMTQHFLEPQYVARRGVKAWLSNLAHHWVNRRTDHLIAISKATLRGAVTRGEAKPNGITVIPNGIAPPDPQSLPPTAVARHELGVHPDTPLVFCAARLAPEKDVATLIDAMAFVVKQFQDAVCLVAGEGSLRNELQERIARLGLDQSVRLLGFRTDVASIMNASDLFVLPSVAEPFGLVLIEAMSLGKAVVAVGVGGPLEIVDDEQTGLLVLPRHSREMATAIGRLLASPEKRKEMGLRGASRYRAEFTVKRMAQQTIGVYHRVLAARVRERARADVDSVSV